MSIDLSILDNLDEVNVWIKVLTNKGLSAATKSSMKRTIPQMGKSSREMVKKYRKTSSTKINARFKFVKKLGTNDINKMEVIQKISKKPLRMIDFVKGKRERQKKKGVEVKKRRKLKAEIIPGRVRRLKGAFIEKGRGGTLMVLRRQGKEARPTERWAGPPIHSLFGIDRFMKPVEREIGVRYKDIFRQTVEQKLRVKLPGDKR